MAMLRHRVALTRLSMAWEELWPRLAPAFGVAALFAIFALFDLLRPLGGIAHSVLLAGFALAFAACLIWTVVKVRWPSLPQARRRLEQANVLPHRPLASLEDRLPADAGGTAEAEQIWQAHRRRIAGGLEQARAPLPEAGWSRIDPWALRAALGLVLVVALGFAGWRAPHRLEAAFLPVFPMAETVLPAIEGWITPPAHTQAAPIFLTRDGLPVQGADGLLAFPPRWIATGSDNGDNPAADRVIDVPHGSQLILRVSHAPGPLRLDLAAGDDEGASMRFEQVDAGNQMIETRIEEGSQIRVSTGEDVLARWQIAVRPDLPPRIAFAEPPLATARNALQLHYEAEDDYGLAGIAALIVPGDEPGQVLELELQLPGLRPTQAGDTSFHDLTAHPWAGRQVEITLQARDEAGQTSLSAPAVIVLPKRNFVHPVARAVVEQRGELGRGTPELDRAELALSSISTVPETFNRDAIVSLALGVAAARLRYAPDAASIGTVQDLLWDTALRLEDGDLSLAERALRSAQQRLMEALARNASEAEIERLVRELREAMEKFLQALLEDTLRNLDELAEADRGTPEGGMLGEDELRRMLDQVEDLAQGGARDAARDLLAELNRMLENMKQGRLMADPQGSKQGQQALQELSEILRDQQRLLDRSFRQGRRDPGRPGRQPGQRGQGQGQGQGQEQEQGQPGMGEDDGEGEGQGLGGDAREQEDLRRRLGRLLDQLAEDGLTAPDAFGRADQSMGGARDALRDGASRSAAEQQSNALDQLRQGMRSLMDQLAEQFDPDGDGSDNAPGRAGSDRRDPLGRPMPGEWEDGSSTRVPDQADLQRAREILEELYRRSGERFRPAEELDYIERLLRRF